MFDDWKDGALQHQVMPERLPCLWEASVGELEEWQLCQSICYGGCQIRVTVSVSFLFLRRSSVMHAWLLTLSPLWKERVTAIGCLLASLLSAVLYDFIDHKRRLAIEDPVD